MNIQEIRQSISGFYKENENYVAETKSPAKGKPYIMGIGANTFFVSDGESSFLIDAYATRNCFRLPIKFGKSMLFADVESKPQNVEEIYKAIGAPAFSHIVCTHNHIDHTMDLRAFYDLCYKYNGTKPKIVGTLSSVNTALGYGVPEEDTMVVHRKKSGFDSIEIGKFKITFLPGKHLKLFAFYKSTYQRKPLKNKGFITAYKEGGVLDFFIEHENMENVLLTSSFGIGEYELSKPVGTLVQAIGGAGKERKTFVKQLYKHNAIDTNAGRVLVSHYDDFFQPLSKGLHFINVSPKLIETMRNEDKEKPVGLLKLFEKIEL